MQTQLRFSRLHLVRLRSLGLPIVLARQALSYRAIIIFINITILLQKYIYPYKKLFLEEKQEEL